MQAYLMQHSEAKAEAEDPARPLTDRGRAEVQRVARRAALLGLPVAEIRHLGKLRARARVYRTPCPAPVRPGGHAPVRPC